jgi:topoisomerase IV subunit A
MEIALSEFLLKNVAAKGKRLSSRTLRKIIPSTGSGLEPAKHNLPLPGLEIQERKNVEESDDQATNGEDEQM